MAWCPQCKEEYEDYVERCSDCKVALVESLEDISKDRVLIILKDQEEVDKVLEFLEYSNITTASCKETKTELEEDAFIITVEEEEWEAASKFLQGYNLVEKEEPDLKDYYFGQYKTIDLEAEKEMTEIKSSYLSFVGLGGLTMVLGLINLMGWANFLSGNMPIILTVIGLVFIGIGFYTKATMKGKLDQAQSIQSEFEKIYQWYCDNYPIKTFYERHSISLESLDEGAKYFALMDIIIGECRENQISDNEELINTVAEKVFSQL